MTKIIDIQSLTFDNWGVLKVGPHVRKSQQIWSLRISSNHREPQDGEKKHKFKLQETEYHDRWMASDRDQVPGWLKYAGGK